MKHIQFIAIILFILPKTVSAQSNVSLLNKIDSIQHLIAKSKHDTLVILGWKAWDDLIYTSNPQLDLSLNLKIDSLCSLRLKQTRLHPKEKYFYHFQRGYAGNNLGLVHKALGQYDKAISYFTVSISDRRKVNDKKGILAASYNISGILQLQGKYDEALKRYMTDIEVVKKEKFNDLLINMYSSIGSVYREKSDMVKSLSYYNQSLKLAQKLNDQPKQVDALSNIAILYRDEGDFSNSLKYFKKAHNLIDPNNIFQLSSSENFQGAVYLSLGEYQLGITHLRNGLRIKKQIGDQQGILQIHGNLASAYMEKADSARNKKNYTLGNQFFQIADHYNDTAINIARNIGYAIGLSDLLINRGLIQMRMGNYKKAIQFSEESFQIATEGKFVHQLKNVSQNLYLLYNETQNYDRALMMYEMHIRLRDSISSEENQRELIKQDLKYQFEKKAAADSVLIVEEKKVNAERLKQEKFQRNILYIGLSITLIFGFFMFNRFRITKKQKNIIEDQKKIVDLQKALVEEKQHEILDSIRYASRIQKAQLPTEKFIDRQMKKLNKK